MAARTLLQRHDDVVVALELAAHVRRAVLAKRHAALERLAQIEEPAHRALMLVDRRRWKPTAHRGNALARAREVQNGAGSGCGAASLRLRKYHVRLAKSGCRPLVRGGEFRVARVELPAALLAGEHMEGRSAKHQAAKA